MFGQYSRTAVCGLLSDVYKKTWNSGTCFKSKAKIWWNNQITKHYVKIYLYKMAMNSKLWVTLLSFICLCEYHSYKYIHWVSLTLLKCIELYLLITLLEMWKPDEMNTICHLKAIGITIECTTSIGQCFAMLQLTYLCG